MSEVDANVSSERHASSPHSKAEVERIIAAFRARPSQSQMARDARVLADALDGLFEQKEAADRVVEAARLLTRRDTFDMRIIQVREDNLLDALREYDAASSPASIPDASKGNTDA